MTTRNRRSGSVNWDGAAASSTDTDSRTLPGGNHSRTSGSHPWQPPGRFLGCRPGGGTSGSWRDRVTLPTPLAGQRCPQFRLSEISHGLTYSPMAPSVETLKRILEAFNRHDLDEIMNYFAEEFTFDFPRGPEPFGERFIGKTAVRSGLARRFEGIPDVHYGEDRHWVANSRGVSEWLLTGTTRAGAKIRVRGCDLWDFKAGKVIRKDSYWKIVE